MLQSVCLSCLDGFGHVRDQPVHSIRIQRQRFTFVFEAPSSLFISHFSHRSVGCRGALDTPPLVHLSFWVTFRFVSFRFVSTPLSRSLFPSAFEFESSIFSFLLFQLFFIVWFFSFGMGSTNPLSYERTETTEDADGLERNVFQWVSILP